MLTHTRLRQLLKYSPSTGRFTWLIDGRNQYQRRGKEAGCLAPNGRILIGIDGKRFLASRLAVFWMTGRWPRRLVDHRNRKPADNRWQNLRNSNSSQNLHNMRMKNNKVGFKGVVFEERTGRFRARIKVNYRSIHLGRFDTAKAAHAAYIAAAKKYFGEYARAK